MSLAGVMKDTVFPPEWPVPIRPSLEPPRRPTIEVHDFPGSLAAVISSLQNTPIGTSLQPVRMPIIEVNDSPGSSANVISAPQNPPFATEDIPMEVDVPDLEPHNPDRAPGGSGRTPLTTTIPPLQSAIISSNSSKDSHLLQHISGITSESELTSLSSAESEETPNPKRLRKRTQPRKNPRATEGKKSRPMISSSDSEPSAPPSLLSPGQALYDMSGRPVLINYLDVDKFEVCFFMIFSLLVSLSSVVKCAYKHS